MKTIAVIGAGFSGTLLSLHLLRQCPPPTRLVLIERNSQFGRGLAYGTPNASHILNVPAARMSAFHDRPNDFLDWLTRQAADQDGAPPGPQTFAPRHLFGAYVRALLNDEIKRSGRDRLELVKGDVVGLDGTVQRLVLQLDRERVIEADMAVLAIGNFPPEPVPIASPGFYDTDFYRADPWAPDALTGLDPDAAVLLLGTGLTTMDLAITLLDQRHQGPIYALSRRGLLPRRHAGVPLPAPDHAPYPTAVNALTRFLRREAMRATAEGSGWQPVIDELRPFTMDVWQAMPLPDRKRFLRHLRPWWDVHRHRMAAQVADRIDAARAGGQLRILVGRLRDLVVQDDQVTVHYRPRRQDEMATITVSRVINCAGPGADYDRIQEPLIRDLLRDGLARPDPLRLGLDVTGNCALLNAQGAISRRLFAVGPITKGAFWEMTAVPDIRRQTEKLAEYLAGLIKAAPPRPAA
ncbi:MAG: FAD/NAD(P)-binding protein [Rhodopila sp.]